MTWKKTIIFRLIIILFFSKFLCAQNEAQKLDSIFSQFNHPYSPGVAVGVIENGKFVFEKGYGMQDISGKKPITPQTNFDIGSNTKQFTATAILLLEEEGKLKRTDDIRKYLTDFPDYGHVITINHLLHMTSGIRDYLVLESFLNTDDLKDKHSTTEYRYRIITHQSSLNFIPGEKTIYSNSNYFLLGLIIEKISGMKWENYIQQNIFQPLGMNHTFFNEDENVSDRAKGYYKLDKNKSGCKHTETELTGHGGIESNLEDLFLWDQNFYHNKLGKTGQLLIEKLTANDTFNNGKKNYYANGIVNYTYSDSFTVWAHTGGWLAFKSAMIHFPGKQLTVICLSNYASFETELTWHVANLYLHIPEKKSNELTGTMDFIPLKTPIDKNLCGLYIDSAADHYYFRKITIMNGELYECFTNGHFYKQSDSTFIRKVPTLNKYLFDSMNGQRYLYIYNTSIPDTFVRKNLDSYDTNFTGKYSCQDLYGFKAHIKIKNGDPYFTHATFKRTGYRFEKNKIYIPSEEITIEFVRNEKGEVTGFYASVDRVRKMWFAKK